MKWWLKLLQNPLILGLLFVHLLLLLFTQFTAWPEMLIYPYLLEHGFAFYGDIVQPYMPFLPYVLSVVFRLFGLSVVTLQYFTVGVIVVIDLVLLRIVQTHYKLLSPETVLAIFIALQVFFSGNGMWFDLFAVVPLLAAFYFALQYLNSEKMQDALAAGFALGIGIITKQTAVWFLMPLLIMVYTRNRKAILPMLLIASIPFISLLIFFRVSDIWNWAIVYPLLKMAKTPGYTLYPNARELIILLILLLPLFLSFVHRGKRLQKPHFIMLWLIAAFGFLFPRFAWFHIQPLAPFLAIAVTTIFLTKKNSVMVKIGKFGYLAFLLFLLLRLVTQELFLPVRFFEPEVIARTAILSTLVPHDQPVFFYNDMGNEMVAGQFLPVKPWAYTFPWYMEIPGLENEIITALERDRVQWVVAKPFGNEDQYVPGSYRPQLIDAYVQSHFGLVTTVDDLTILKRL